MNKNMYELSVWEDFRVVVDGANDYFDERKIGVLSGSEDSNSLRAYNVNLKEEINGNLSLTFTIPYKVFDEGTQSLINNPRFFWLANERKLKLRQGEEYSCFNEVDSFDPTLLEAEDLEQRWKTFIVKTIDKDSTTYLATVTAKELFVNELGKNGWDTLLNTELENNFGTIIELGEEILKNSDWEVDFENSYSPTETIEEPLFYTTIKTAGVGSYVLSGSTATLALGKPIYLFYSSVELDENNDWKIKDGIVQACFLDREIEGADINDNRCLIDEELAYNVEVNGSLLNLPQMTGGIGTLAVSGKRIEKSQISFLEPVSKRYVKKYKSNNSSSGAPVGAEVYGYTETEYLTGSIAKNRLTNSQNFTSILGWSGDLTTKLFPDITQATIDDNYFSYISLKLDTAERKFYNNGPRQNGLELVKDKIYVVRAKGRWINKIYRTDLNSISTTRRARVMTLIEDEDGVEYTNQGEISPASIDSSTDITKKGYAKASANARTGFNGTNLGVVYNDADGYTYSYMKASSTTTNKKLRFSISNDIAVSTHDFCIEDIQFFEYAEDVNGAPIFYGDIPTSTIKQTNVFFTVSGKDIVKLSVNEGYYNPVYSDGFQSVRSIEVKETNYFNAIQSLAEVFEVWVKFQISHRKDGRILLVNGAPVKKVVFSRYSPYDKINFAGFKYGINLKGIKRNVDSDGVATKVIVKPNMQKYAIDGMCSISRAKANPSGENEILNFDYYINQGFLTYTSVLNDLYGTSNSDFRYYPKLKAFNKSYDEYGLLLVAAETDKMNWESEKSVHDKALVAAQDELALELDKYNKLNPKDQANLLPNIQQLRAKIRQYTRLADTADLSLAAAITTINNCEAAQSQILLDKIDLKKSFYKKYSRFIQEGSWVEESYVDDELYYLDAQKLAAVSAYPKASYAIDVIDLEGSEDFSGYSFNIGERTFIEDKEFFGTVVKVVDTGSGVVSVEMPYRMEVVVSERNRDLDDPTKSSIVVKNYKSQHEELFQQMQASTQSLQFATGGFMNAAGAVTPMGEIEATTLERSFARNSVILSSSQNQDVVFDTGIGIEITDRDNKNLKLRLVAGGIFLSRDGGQTWTQGITGDGINTRHLLAGQIDTSKINIVQGEVPYFRWDKTGISAFEVDDSQAIPQYDTTHYVKFNQFGLYGYNGGMTTESITFGADYNVDKILREYSVSLADFNSANGTSYTEQTKFDSFEEPITFQVPGVSIDAYIARTDITMIEKLDYIRNNASFSLTYKGVYLKGQDGAVSLSPENGFEIFGEAKFPSTVSSLTRNLNPVGAEYVEGDPVPLVSLGKFYDDLPPELGGEPEFGLRMRNNQGEVTLDTDSNGNLWVRGQLTVGQEDPYSPTPTSENFINIDGTSGTINTGTVESGNWWAINGDGSASFKNVNVRGVLEAVAFKRNTVSAVGGSLLVAPTAILEEDIAIVDGKILIGSFVGDDWIGVAPFDTQPWSITDAVLINNPDIQDAHVPVLDDDGSRYIDVSSLVTQYGITSLLKGTNIISVDTSTNTIKMTAEDGFNQSGPLFEMRGPQNDVNPSTVFIGNLDGVLGGTEFDEVADPGYGIFTDNAYLTGRMYLPQVGLTNEGSADSAVRIWAGAHPENKENAPFRVTQDGSLYAEKGVFKGALEAASGTFNGTVIVGPNTVFAEGYDPSQVTGGVKFQYNIYTKPVSGTVLAGQIVVSDVDGYFPLALGCEFDTNKPILYAQEAIADGGLSSTNHSYAPDVDLTGLLTGNPLDIVYIAGQLNGTSFVVDDTMLLTTTPIDNGMVYMVLGQLFDTNRMILHYKHPFYRFDSGVLKSFDVITLEGGVPADKAVTFYQPTQPVSTALRTGDIWYDTTATLSKMWVWNGTAWADKIADMAYANAEELAKLQKTIIEGGYINTSLLNAEAINTEVIRIGADTNYDPGYDPTQLAFSSPNLFAMSQSVDGYLYQGKLDQNADLYRTSRFFDYNDENYVISYWYKPLVTKIVLTRVSYYDINQVYLGSKDVTSPTRTPVATSSVERVFVEPHMVSSNIGHSLDRVATNAFDENTSSIWQPLNANGAQLTVSFSEKKYITKLRFYMQHILYVPKNYVIEGSDDEVVWTQVVTGVFTKATSWQEVTFSPVGYRSWRIIIVDSYHATVCQISEVEFYEIKTLRNEFKTTYKLKENFPPLANAKYFRVSIGFLGVTENGKYINRVKVEKGESGSAWSLPAEDSIYGLGYGSYDNLVSEALNGRTIIQGGFLRTELIKAGSIFTDLLAANSITTEKLNVYAKNLINNFSLTQSFDNWVMNSEHTTNGAWQTSTDGLAIWFTGIHHASNPRTSQTVPFEIRPDKDYAFSIEFMSNFQAMPVFTFGVIVYDKDDNILNLLPISLSTREIGSTPTATVFMEERVVKNVWKRYESYLVGYNSQLQKIGENCTNAFKLDPRAKKVSLFFTTLDDQPGDWRGYLKDPTAKEVGSGAIHADCISAGYLSADRIEAGSLNANKITAGTITAEQLAANSITTEKLNVYVKNLINNFSLTQSFDNWIMDSVHTNSGTWEDGADGLAIWRAHTRPYGGTNPATSKTLPFEIRPDKDYAFSIEFMCDYQHMPIFTFGVIVYDKDDNILNLLPISLNSREIGSTPTDTVFIEERPVQNVWKRYESYLVGYNSQLQKIGENCTNAFKLDARAKKVSLFVTTLESVNLTNWRRYYFKDPMAKEVGSGTIHADCITAGYLSADRIEVGSLNANKITANSITATSACIHSLNADKITTGYLSADRIEAGSLNADKITANSITATSACIHSLNADKITTGYLSADRIQARSISSSKISSVQFVASGGGYTTTIDGDGFRITSGGVEIGGVTAVNGVVGMFARYLTDGDSTLRMAYRGIEIRNGGAAGGGIYLNSVSGELDLGVSGSGTALVTSGGTTTLKGVGMGVAAVSVGAGEAVITGDNGTITVGLSGINLGGTIITLNGVVKIAEDITNLADVIYNLDGRLATVESTKVSNTTFNSAITALSNRVTALENA